MDNCVTASCGASGSYQVPRPTGGASGTEASFKCVYETVSCVFGVGPRELKRKRHGEGSHYIRIRHIALYLLHVGIGVSTAEIAEHFAINRSTIAYACRRIEAERDDPLMDGVINELETRIGHLLRKCRRPVHER